MKEHKYKKGDTVYTQTDQRVKLIVRRYIKRIYYCQFPDDPTRKELALFERELIDKPQP
ncbi:hypothetical protein SAMN04488028_11013 [Reichenbachiella agariperforans]|uniref:Uncharacterized protein n=1 Tax=Reichenbachiella agariperforans TaxID=156994 RepID=A0A1M6VVD7_REIAG|nr:hypothetical protein [Reichenbachiella agariperforans]SHK85417.1 hypothetical protein SAMN04488028_11013 [Reichenbachiella agariperforans]